MKKRLQDYPEYSNWRAMIKRCYVKSAANYKKYGAVGVTVCDRWRFGEHNKHGFFCFLEDVGAKPYAEASIDRLDSSLPYTPANCRWASVTEQNRNLTKNLWVEYNGDKHLLFDLLVTHKIPLSTGYRQFNKGVPLQTILRAQ